MGFKIIWNIVSLLGLLIILPLLVASFSTSQTWVNSGQLGSGFGYYLEWLACIVGTILALLGNFITKWKYFWIGAIIVGFVYISSFYGAILKDTVLAFILLLPGIVLIIGGILLRITWLRTTKH